MRTRTILLGGAAGLLLAANAAWAGTCTAEIDALEKAIAAAGTVASSSNPTGANATAASQAEGNTNSAMPGGTVPAPGEIPDQTASAEPIGQGGGSEGTRTPPGAIEQPDAAGGQQANAAITGSTGNAGAGGAPAATAPQDSTVPESGPAISAATGADPDAASQSLARARMLDQAGDETGCMKEVTQAKSQLGQL